jgi:pimeloyl-ACP methyl ester carboxylesterase
MGGAIALAMAARHPTRIDRVALLAPYAPGFPLGREFSLWVNRIARIPLLGKLLLRRQTREQFEASSASAVRDVAELLARDDGQWRDYPWTMFNVRGMRDAWAATARHFTSSWKRALPALPRLGGRALILWGEQDRIVSPAGLAPMAEQVGATPVSLADCGHCPHLEQPDAVNRLLLEHFAATALL